ncbi:MAG: PAAR-like protein [Flavobacterium sp.]
MATPIPYTIQKGDTLGKIAEKLKINNWKDLQVYHNNNCPLNEQIGTNLKVDHILYTPSEDEIAEMNGVSKGKKQPESEKKEEKAQDEKPKEEKKKDEKKEESKSEHDGKYYVVHGGTCVCDKAEDPTKEAELQVTTHKKMIYNDQAKKFAATEEDKQFNPPTATFGKCTLKPSSSGYLPCALAPAPKWDKPYDKTKVMGKCVLTEISELKCMVGGKITVKKHGQTDATTSAHAQNTDPAEMAHANPAVKKPITKAEYPSVEYITIESIENRDKFKAVKSKDDKTVEKIYVRPEENCSFTANINKGNKSLTSWVIYEGFEAKSDQKLLTKEQIGTSFSNSFPATGDFRVEGYGKPKKAEFEKGEYDKNYPSCSIDITVTINKLNESKLELYGEDFAAKIKDEVRLRKDFPAAFKAKFLISPTTEELDRLEMFVTDEAGNRLTNYKQEGKVLSFTPNNADAVYNFHAIYTDEEGKTWEQSFKGKTLAKNYVVSISHTDQVVREFSPIGFEVKQMKIGSLIAADNDLTEGEIQDIKWDLNGVYQNSGRVLSIPKGLALGNYVAEAYCSMSNGFGVKAKKEEDDWHFEVKRNDVVDIQADSVLKVGKKALFTANSFVFKDLMPNEKVNWTLNGQSVANTTAIKSTPTSPGNVTVTAKINAEKGITKSFKVVQPVLENVMFTDSNGIEIQKSAWGNKVHIWLKEKYLTGEKLKVALYDKGTPVYYFPEKVYDGGLLDLELNDELRKYTKDYAELKVMVNSVDLNFPKEGELMGMLEVGFARGVYSGQIGSEDGTKKHVPLDYDMVSWFYGKSRGIKETEKVTIEIWEYNLIFNEKLLTGVTSPDKSGAIKLKIDWSNIPKGKQGQYKNIFVKVLDNANQNEELYNGSSVFTRGIVPLIAKSEVKDLAGYSSAAVVGSTSVSISSIDNKFGVCEYEARVRAFLRMLRVGEGTQGEAGYTTAFNNNKITDLSKHPEINYGGSTAAGAYQIMRYTWWWLNGHKLNGDNEKTGVYEAYHDYAKKYDIEDYKQESQDRLCLILMKHTKKGLIDNIVNGNTEAAIKTASETWASLPYENDNSRYKFNGQPQPATPLKQCIEDYKKFLKEELENKSDLHLKKGFLREFGYANCIPVNAPDGIVTYRVYQNGIIEKHIPKSIKAGFENKYKYIYHGSKNVQNEICTVEWNETIQKQNGQRFNNKPTHSPIVSEVDVVEGQTRKRVKYENDDIAEYGSNDGQSFWNLYKCAEGKPKIEVVRMPDSLNYQKNGVIIAYTFSDTQRRYTSPGALAGFIGALAECGYTDVKTTGSCFKEGSCFPSVSHVNGKSIDTQYLDDSEQQKKIIASMKKFKFSIQITGTDATHSYVGTTHDSHHNSHLHSGFDEPAVLIVKEK